MTLKYKRLKQHSAFPAMGRRILVLSHLFFLCFTLGCSHLFPGLSHPKGESFSLPGAYEDVWSATLEVLSDENIAVHISDADKGYLQTKTFPLYKPEYKAWSKKPLYAPSGYCMVEIGLAKESKEAARVGVRAFFRRKHAFYFFGFRKEDPSRGVFEKLLLGRINDRLVKIKWPKFESIIVGCTFRFDDSIGRYRIAEAEPGGLAYEQGLRMGDVLLAVDGKEVRYENLFEFFLNVEGESLRRFKIRRGWKEKEIEVSVFYVDPGMPRLGMTVVRDKLARKFKIVGVSEDSPAAHADLRKDDILIEQNGISLDGWLPYYRAMVGQKNQTEQVFLIARSGKKLTCRVNFENAQPENREIA